MGKKTKKTKKVFIVNPRGPLYSVMFRRKGWELTDNLSKADLVQFTSGVDVTPQMYGHYKHPNTICDIDRDLQEQLIYLSALKLGKPMAGICRGGQFLNVMNGGSLWQNITGHSGKHKATFTNLQKAQEIEVTSSHHQLMEPVNNSKRFVILMLACVSGKRAKCNALDEPVLRIINLEKIPNDIEALWYKDTNCLCFQPHPEWDGENELARVYFGYIDKLLLKQ